MVHAQTLETVARVVIPQRVPTGYHTRWVDHGDLNAASAAHANGAPERLTDTYILGALPDRLRAQLVARGARRWPTICADAAHGAMRDAGIEPGQVEVGHVGNFAAELYCGQGHLGGLLVEADPAFAGLPTSRHEAACASGSVAVLAAIGGHRGRAATTARSSSASSRCAP